MRLEPALPPTGLVVVEQRLATQVGGRRQPPLERGRADDHQRVVGELVDDEAGMAAVPVSDPDVDRLGGEVDQVLARRDAHVDVGVALEEAAQARHQPAGAKRRDHAHRHHTASPRVLKRHSGAPLHPGCIRTDGCSARQRLPEPLLGRRDKQPI